MTRSSMLEVLGQDYLRTARAKGLEDRLVVIRHALKNALIPIVTVIGLQFGSLISGAFLTETVFGRPVWGDTLLPRLALAIIRRSRARCWWSRWLVLINLLVDVAYAAIDPRIHYA